MLLVGRLVIAILTAKVAAFWGCAYVSADIALYAFTTRPLFHVVFPLTVTAQFLTSQHILFAARAAV